MRVANIQRFCMHDGPGIRTTVFLKGCPLSCAWCHNPETQSNQKEILLYENKCIGCGACLSCPHKAHQFSETHIIKRDLCMCCGECVVGCPTNALEIIGKDYTIQELIQIIEKDQVFYGENGGVTISGGEPFWQADDTLSFLQLCKQKKINTAVETCGHTSPNVIKKAAPFVDLFLWDLKDSDSERHKKYTGVPNEQIVSNLLLADSCGAKTLIRCILVNGINTNPKHYEDVANIMLNLKHCEGVEFLPYHSFGISKSVALGKTNLEKDVWIPTDEQIREAKYYMQNKGILVI